MRKFLSSLRYADDDFDALADGFLADFLSAKHC